MKDDGVAFPAINQCSDGSLDYHSGMSLRDWFAGMALQGLMANQQFAEIDYERLARWAYNQAQAMLEERGKR